MAERKVDARVEVGAQHPSDDGGGASPPPDVTPRLGSGGPELVAAIRRAGFDTPVLFMSGYTDDALIGVQELGEQVELLPKPFRPRELIGRVRLALDVDDGG